MSTSSLVLTLFIAWTLFLLVLMEGIRSYLVVSGRARSNEFKPDNANLSPFLQRLARAHANCIESLPVVGGLLLVAIVTGRSGVTDGLAPWLLVARMAQSVTHLVSLSVLAVNVRFFFFAVQLAIAIYWTCALLAG
ncbi:MULTISPECIES: MAPEG family protein [unclassified Dyella]|uniref:MAPEG family protein n=1 Tax=unclassified Dyella TaxID=2634549 RepID=UPI003F8EEA4C